MTKKHFIALADVIRLVRYDAIIANARLQSALRFAKRAGWSELDSDDSALSSTNATNIEGTQGPSGDANKTPKETV